MLPAATLPPTLTATRRQEAANQHQRAEARQGKADTMSAVSVKQPPELSVKPASKRVRPTATRRQDVANGHQRNQANLGFA